MIYAPWNITKWLGRVALWLVFWPVGLWRSIRHGQAKRDARIVEELRRP
jgi:hypothetical protein